MRPRCSRAGGCATTGQVGSDLLGVRLSETPGRVDPVKQPFVVLSREGATGLEAFHPGAPLLVGIQYMSYFNSAFRRRGMITSV